jgi:hypothetical protein
LGLRGDRSAASSPPLWGRTKERGRAVLRDKQAAAHSIISPVGAIPHPGPPPQEGAGALTPSILPKCSRLWLWPLEELAEFPPPLWGRVRVGGRADLVGSGDLVVGRMRGPVDFDDQPRIE